MKILLIGATGRTGKHILQECLDRGHQVNAIVRNKTKVNTKNESLALFEGLPNDEKMIEEAIKGCEAVLFALNVSRTSDWPWAKLRSPEKLVSRTIDYLVKAMKKNKIKRILTLSAWGTHETFQELPSWFRWLIRNSNVKYPYADHERHEDALKASKLDFTILRPAGLTNAKKLRELVVTIDGQPKPSFTISRRQVAIFMLDCLEQKKYIGQLPTISEK